MNVELPDGTVLTDVPEGTTKAQLREKLGANGYDVSKLGPDDSNYGNEGYKKPLVNPAASGTATERYGAGFAGGANSIRVAINDAIEKLNNFGTNAFPPEVQQQGAQQRQAWRNQDQQYQQTKDQLGFAGAAGDISPELLATAVPIAKGGSLLARGAGLMGAGRLAPAVGDVAANALYSGGKRMASNAIEGREATDGALDEFLTGGAFAAGGRAALRGADIAARGVKPFMSANARELVGRGVLPTPGQLFDGPAGTVLSRAEDKAMSLPIAGDIIGNARRRSLGDYNRVSINDAIAPLGKKAAITGSGIEAVEQAQRHVSDAFEAGLQGMHVQPKTIATILADAQELLPHVQLLDDAQAAQVQKYIDQRIRPLIDKGGVDGQVAKQLDAELGHLARKYSRSINPGDHPLGEAFDVLQHGWRGAMAHPTSGGNNALVRQANLAYRQMLPITKAADKALAQGGTFTPNQLARSRVVTRTGPAKFDRAAQEVLPSRVPDSGSAGRMLASGLLGGGGFTMAPTTTAVTTGLAALAYSRPGIHMLINGMSGFIPEGAQAWLKRLPPQEAVQALSDLAARNPQAARQMAAQLARRQQESPPPSPPPFR